jgi:pyridoxamine 5'-phosphate oxidase
MPEPSLAGMRRAYSRTGLAETDLAPTWWEQFAAWFAEAVAALPEPNAMVVATATDDGRPSARTVLLKDVSEQGLTFFTNLDSRKGREAAGNPRAALVFPWFALQRQVVIDGDLEEIEPAAADAYFATRERGSQLGAQASQQSAVIAGRDVLDEAYARAAEKWPEGQPVPRPERWGGLRVVPHAVEFWQGRPDRLHDRLRYRREGGAWRVERLAP